MQFNINRPPKYIQRERDRQARREWHKKFAWKTTVVDKTDEGHRIVWFENYWRKEKIGPTSADCKGDGHYFESYSEKEYFKKKLNGDFERAEYDYDYGYDEETDNTTGVSFGGQTVAPGVTIKRYIVGGVNEDIEMKLYDENGEEIEE